jgi:hypothetical protein
MMGCLFVIFAGFFPRLTDIFLWLARPTLFTLPFGGNWIWPALGILFLPFTTLFYVIMWSPGIGVTGWDWFWIVVAMFLDISSLVSNYQANRDRLPWTSSGQPA